MVKFNLYDASYDLQDAANRIKKQKTMALNTPNPSIPLHERYDQFPSTASSINKGLDFKIQLKHPHERIPAIDEPTLRHQIAVNNYFGGKLLRDSHYNYKYKTTKICIPGKRHFKIDNDHILNILSEAKHGLRSVDHTTKQVLMKSNQNVVGHILEQQRHGYERMKNPVQFPKLPFGAPQSTEPSPPNMDVFRFNKNVVDQVTTFPMNAF